MLSEQQLELAARKLCQIRGIDPDKLIPHGAKPDKTGYVPAILLHSPAWRLAVDEIKRAEEIKDAVRDVVVE